MSADVRHRPLATAPRRPWRGEHPRDVSGSSRTIPQQAGPNTTVRAPPLEVRLGQELEKCGSVVDRIAPHGRCIPMRNTTSKSRAGSAASSSWSPCSHDRPKTGNWANGSTTPIAGPISLVHDRNTLSPCLIRKSGCSGRAGVPEPDGCLHRDSRLPPLAVVPLHDIAEEVPEPVRLK